MKEETISALDSIKEYIHVLKEENEGIATDLKNRYLKDVLVFIDKLISANQIK